MSNYFISFQYLSILLVPISILFVTNRAQIKLNGRGLLLILIGLYSIIPNLPLKSEMLVRASIISLSAIVSLLVYQQLLPILEKTELRQKRRALKKIPVLVMLIFFTTSKLVELPTAYALVGISFILVERSYWVAFFSWPFLIINFFESSAIIEWMILFSQSVSIFLLKEKNE